MRVLSPGADQGRMGEKVQGRIKHKVGYAWEWWGGGGVNQGGNENTMDQRKLMTRSRNRRSNISGSKEYKQESGGSQGFTEGLQQSLGKEEEGGRDSGGAQCGAKHVS